MVIVQSLVDHLGTGEGDSLLLEGGLDTPVRIEDLGVGVAHGQADTIARTPSDGGQLLQCGIVLEQVVLQLGEDLVMFLGIGLTVVHETEWSIRDRHRTAWIGDVERVLPLPDQLLVLLNDEVLVGEHRLAEVGLLDALTGHGAGGRRGAIHGIEELLHALDNLGILELSRCQGLTRWVACEVVEEAEQDRVTGIRLGRVGCPHLGLAGFEAVDDLDCCDVLPDEAKPVHHRLVPGVDDRCEEHRFDVAEDVLGVGELGKHRGCEPVGIGLDLPGLEVTGLIN